MLVLGLTVSLITLLMTVSYGNSTSSCRIVYISGHNFDLSSLDGLLRYTDHQSKNQDSYMASLCGDFKLMPSICHQNIPDVVAMKNGGNDQCDAYFGRQSSPEAASLLVHKTPSKGIKLEYSGGSTCKINGKKGSWKTSFEIACNHNSRSLDQVLYSHPLIL